MKRIYYPATKLSVKKFSAIFLSLFFLTVSFTSNAQVLVTLYKETFPNKNNEVLTCPVNQAFAGSTGGWMSYSTTAKATVGCFPAAYNPVTNAVKMVHLSTSGTVASDAYATSPTYNLSNPGCYGKYDVSFNLYTYNCVSGDNNAYLALEFSKDGGTTWDVVWQKTSGQLYAAYGVNNLPQIWVALPAVYLNGNFKYRFRSHMNANNANTFYVFIDDATVYAYSCSDMLSVGNLVWLDVNKNGIKEATESGLAGVTLQIIKDNDGDGINDGDFTPLTTTTNVNGNYLFTNLTAGKYLISLVNVNLLHRLTSLNAGGPDEDGDNNNNGLSQTATYTTINGGWITLLPQSEPTNDGDGNNGNLTYDFAVYPASALPVKDVRLNISNIDSKTVINWSTINEVNVKMFEAEKSIDNKNYIKIAQQAATATNNGNASYSIQDITGSNTASAIFYRIKIIDNDGGISYSNTAMVRNAAKRDAVTVFPNPFVNEVKIYQMADADCNLVATLADNTGKIILTQNFKAVAGYNQFTIGNLSKIAQGIYTISIYNTTKNLVTNYKLVK